MGNPLFGIDISGIIHSAISPGLLKGKLMKSTSGSRTAGSLTGGTNPTSKSYNFRGILEEFAREAVDGTRILASDKRALIIGDSLPKGIVPDAGDELEIESTKFKVVSLVDRDPAAAHYVVQVR